MKRWLARQENSKWLCHVVDRLPSEWKYTGRMKYQNHKPIVPGEATVVFTNEPREIEKPNVPLSTLIFAYAQTRSFQRVQNSTVSTGLTSVARMSRASKKLLLSKEPSELAPGIVHLRAHQQSRRFRPGHDQARAEEAGPHVPHRPDGPRPVRHPRQRSRLRARAGEQGQLLSNQEKATRILNRNLCSPLQLWEFDPQNPKAVLDLRQHTVCRF